jgi:hypothetical protein
MKSEHQRELEERLTKLADAIPPHLSIVEAVMQRVAKISFAPARTKSIVRLTSLVRGRRIAAAAAVIAVVLIGYALLPARHSNQIVWADVLQRITQAKTMAFWHFAGGERTRVWMKDPGSLRLERYDQKAASQPSRALLPSEVEISPVPGTEWDLAVWRPADKTACRRRSVGCPTFERRALVATYWANLRKMSANKTRRVGQEKLGRASTVIFEAPAQELLAPLPNAVTGTARMWVDEATGEPVQLELRYREPGDAEERVVLASDIRWDVPITDDLFQMPQLDDQWTVTDVLAVCFSNQRLKPGVTFRLGSPNQPPIATEADMECVSGGDAQVTTPGDTERRTVYFRLTQAASERVKAYTGAHIGEVMLLNFNNQVEDRQQIMAPWSTGLACDITSLGKSLEQFEADYLAPSP